MQRILIFMLVSLSALASITGEHYIKINSKKVNSILVSLKDDGTYTVIRAYKDGYTKSNEVGSYKFENNLFSFRPVTIEQCDFTEQNIGLSSGLKFLDGKLSYEYESNGKVKSSPVVKVDDKVLKHLRSLKPCV